MGIGDEPKTPSTASPASFCGSSLLSSGYAQTLPPTPFGDGQDDFFPALIARAQSQLQAAVEEEDYPRCEILETEIAKLEERYEQEKNWKKRLGGLLGEKKVALQAKKRDWGNLQDLKDRIDKYNADVEENRCAAEDDFANSAAPEVVSGKGFDACGPTVVASCHNNKCDEMRKALIPNFMR